MKIAVSNLPYQGLFTNRLIKLPMEIGVEVYSETGSDYYWDHLLPRLLAQRTGIFSVHGPYQNIDLSSPDLDCEDVFRFYSWTFELCRKYGAAHCVCHPYSYRPLHMMPDAETAERKLLCLERVISLSRMADDYGVALLVENMPDRDGLLSQKEFLDLFGKAEELRFLIDTGHANIQNWDMDLMFKSIGNRILGYHLNDNFGDADSHLKVFEGTFDWKQFFSYAGQYTPDATFVCEYMQGTIDEIVESVSRITAFFNSRQPFERTKHEIQNWN